jgi:hypothetical protein
MTDAATDVRQEMRHGPRIGSGKIDKRSLKPPGE